MLANVSDRNPVVERAKNCGIKMCKRLKKNSRARRLLPDDHRKAFANRGIVCVEYRNITDADEREIFQVCPSF